MEKKVSFNGIALLILTINNENYFKAQDLAEILDYSTTNRALRLLDNDEKLRHQNGASGQRRLTWFVNESGLYHLIISSTKPEAKKFRKWVTGEVLPEIRKAGSYITDKEKYKQTNLQDIKKLIDVKKKTIIETKSDLKEMETELHKLDKEFWGVFSTDPNQLQLFSPDQLQQ